MIAPVAKQLDWHRLLVDGYEPLKKAQKVFRRLPHDPRCTLCHSPFAGVGGTIVGWVGRKPSRKNPNLCQACFNALPSGGIEIDIGIVFADVRGSTAMGEQSSATEFAARLNRFYETATEVFVRHDGLIDKLIGDEVMALFIPGLAGADYRRKAALAALDLAAAVGDLPVGVAANAGIAFVGNVGSGTVMDFTALGDAVNLGARLQSHARPGQVVLVTPLYDLVAADHPVAHAECIEVRGRNEPVDIRVVAV
jgi:adenylate cyclase